MALRAVIDHPKFARLKAILKVNKSTALGYLECLWHFCGRYTPQGNIGKYTDADIEAWLEWDGEDGALIAAFIKARWIDEHPTERLVVHDWNKHADDATRLALKRAKLTFTVETNDAVPTVTETCPDTVATTSGLPEPGAEPVSVPEADTSPNGEGACAPSKGIPKGAKRSEYFVSLLPESHQTEDLRRAVRENFQMRRERGLAALQETSLKKAAAEFAKYPPDVLVRAYDDATQKGYQGVFPEKHVRGSPSNAATPQPGKTAADYLKDRVTNQLYERTS